MRVEDGLPAGNRQCVERADRAARIVFEVIEIRRVVALVHALEESEMDFHQVLEAVKNATGGFGIKVARHLFRGPSHDKIDVEFRTDLPDGSCESHSVILWLQGTGLQGKMLLQVSAQQRCVELGFEAEVVSNDNRLHISIHHYANHALFETRHGDRLVHKRVFRTTKLTQFNTSLAHLFGSGVVADNQHLKVGLCQVTRVK